MTSALTDRIDAILDSTPRMELATSVGELNSRARMIFARDGEDFLFFTFNSTRAARQIRFNPRVQMSIRAAGGEGVHGLHIEGDCFRIRGAEAVARAREKVSAVTDIFQVHMDDEFFGRNNLTGYYRIKPTRITLVDSGAESGGESLEFAHNRRGVFAAAPGAVGSRMLLWLQALRAPFFSATLVPVLLGATIAHGDLAAAGQFADWSWKLFWLVAIGAVAAHAGANLANDYGDHISGNDALNRVPSPFNGGSRVIQSGLLAPWKILLASILCFITAIGIGLGLNSGLAGAAWAPTPLLFIGLCGCLLGITYTLGPFRLGYRGLGEFAIAIGFGPVIVLGAHYVLSAPLAGAWNWLPPLLASLPVAVFALLIIWINQFQDVPADHLADKRNWVLRWATIEDGRIAYERPFGFYRLFGYLGFGLVVSLGIAGGIDPRVGTLYALLALAPLPLLIYANRLGHSWLEDWNRADADRERLPYALLRVNAITIGIHFITGILLVLAYSLRASV